LIDYSETSELDNVNEASTSTSKRKAKAADNSKKKKKTVRIGLVGQISDQSFNFNSIGGWNSNFQHPITAKTSLSMVIKKPVNVNVDLDEEFKTIFANIEKLQDTAPGDPESHEHFLKGIGTGYGIRLVHSLFKVHLLLI
jgi:hypothetical protein